MIGTTRNIRLRQTDNIDWTLHAFLWTKVKPNHTVYIRVSILHKVQTSTLLQHLVIETAYVAEKLNKCSAHTQHLCTNNVKLISHYNGTIVKKFYFVRREFINACDTDCCISIDATQTSITRHLMRCASKFNIKSKYHQTSNSMHYERLMKTQTNKLHALQNNKHNYSA